MAMTATPTEGDVIRRPTYIRFEILRTLRNWRFMIFSLAFPLVLFITVAASNRNAQLGESAFRSIT